MPLFGGLSGILGQMIPGAAVSRGFHRTLDKEDLGFTDTLLPAGIACKNGEWNTIGEFQIKAQTKIRFGFGKPTEPENQGALYVLLDDETGTEVEGMVRLTYMDYNRYLHDSVYDEKNKNLSGSATNRNSMRLLQETPTKIRADGMAGQDDWLILEFKPVGAKLSGITTVVPAHCSIGIPITQY